MTLEELNELAFGEEGFKRIEVTPELHAAFGANDGPVIGVYPHPMACLLTGRVIVCTPEQAENRDGAVAFIRLSDGVVEVEGEDGRPKDAGHVASVTVATVEAAAA